MRLVLDHSSGSQTLFSLSVPTLGASVTEQTDRTTGFQTVFPAPSAAIQLTQNTTSEAGPGASQEDMPNPPPTTIPTAAKAPACCSLVNSLGIQAELILPWGRQMN